MDPFSTDLRRHTVLVVTESDTIHTKLLQALGAEFIYRRETHVHKAAEALSTSAYAWLIIDVTRPTAFNYARTVPLSERMRMIVLADKEITPAEIRRLDTDRVTVSRLPLRVGQVLDVIVGSADESPSSIRPLRWPVAPKVPADPIDPRK